MEIRQGQKEQARWQEEKPGIVPATSGLVGKILSKAGVAKRNAEAGVFMLSHRTTKQQLHPRRTFATRHCKLSARCCAVFETDDGVAKVKGAEVPLEVEPRCREATDACPVEAITITE